MSDNEKSGNIPAPRPEIAPQTQPGGDITKGNNLPIFQNPPPPPPPAPKESK